MESEESKKNQELENERSFSEKRWKDALTFYKLTLTIISSIIIFVSIIIGLVSYTSKRDVDEAIKDMQAQFKDLQKQTVTIPNIEIKYHGRLLDNQVIDLITNKDSEPSTYTLSKIELFNKGNGQTTYPSINLFFADSIHYVPNPQLNIWVKIQSNDDYYKYGYQIRIDNWDTPDLTVIYPQESDYLMDFNFTAPSQLNELQCQAVVYYENGPASSSFTLRLKWVYLYASKF